MIYFDDKNEHRAKRHLNIISHGTFCFKMSRELLEHADIVFNDNGTLSTKPVHPLIYIPEMSNGTEEDLVIMPNIALFVSNTEYHSYKS